MTAETSTWATKKGLAQMLKGGVIMDVVTPVPSWHSKESPPTFGPRAVSRA
jgi:pyridoxal biosynthesis lyase PdxS